MPRDFSMYENNKYGDVKAEVLTKSKLDEWYTKYITGGTSADVSTTSTFQKIYRTSGDVVNEGKYESLIDIYAYYWLCTANGSYGTYRVNPLSTGVFAHNNGAFRYAYHNYSTI